MPDTTLRTKKSRKRLILIVVGSAIIIIGVVAFLLWPWINKNIFHADSGVISGEEEGTSLSIKWKDPGYSDSIEGLEKKIAATSDSAEKVNFYLEQSSIALNKDKDTKAALTYAQKADELSASARTAYSVAMVQWQIYTASPNDTQKALTIKAFELTQSRATTENNTQGPEYIGSENALKELSA